MSYVLYCHNKELYSYHLPTSLRWPDRSSPPFLYNDVIGRSLYKNGGEDSSGHTRLPTHPPPAHKHPTHPPTPSSHAPHPPTPSSQAPHPPTHPQLTCTPPTHPPTPSTQAPHPPTHPQLTSTPPTYPQLAVSLLPALKIQQEMLFVLISVMVACMLEELLKPETPSVKAITPAETETTISSSRLSQKCKNYLPPRCALDLHCKTYCVKSRVSIIPPLIHITRPLLSHYLPFAFNTHRPLLILIVQPSLSPTPPTLTFNGGPRQQVHAKGACLQHTL